MRAARFVHEGYSQDYSCHLKGERAAGVLAKPMSEVRVGPRSKIVVEWSGRDWNAAGRGQVWSRCGQFGEIMC